MAACQSCGREHHRGRPCRYCGETYCLDHHPPSRHDCGGVRDGASEWLERSDTVRHRHRAALTAPEPTDNPTPTTHDAIGVETALRWALPAAALAATAVAVVLFGPNTLPF